MVQTIDRCHVPLLKNVKTFAFWEYDKGYYGICFILVYKYMVKFKYYNKINLTLITILQILMQNTKY